MIIDTHTHIFDKADGYQFTYRLTSYKDGKVWLDKVPAFENLPCVIEYRERYPITPLYTTPAQDAVWGREGGRLWGQWLPEHYTNTNSPPEVFVERMDEAGVDKTVLLQAPCYRWPDMNEYLSTIIKRYPDRFVASAQIDASGGNDQIDKLVHAVTELGLTSLKIEMSDHCGLPLLELHGPFHLDDPKRDDLWRTCVELNIPVVLDIDFYGNPPPQARELRNVCERFPEMVFVFCHNARWGVGQPEVMQLALDFNVWVELDFANAWETSKKNNQFDPDANLNVFKLLYDSVGADRMLWATDAPWAFTYASYAESMGFVQNSSFLTEEEKAKILGENGWKVFFERTGSKSRSSTKSPQAGEARG